MPATTVHVSNIAPNTSEQEVSNFFSFCGKIESLSITPSSGAADSPLSATITFAQSSAANTAVLLDSTPLNQSSLKVEAAHTIEEIAGSHLGPDTTPGPDGEIPQESKPRSAILAEYLAAGYLIGDTALQAGIDFDKKSQFTSRFASYLTNALTKIDGTVHATERAKAADSQYHITEKAWSATTGLARYFEKALETGTGQRIRKFYQESEKQALDIHNEARRLAELKLKEKRKSQEVAAAAPPPPAEEKTGCTCDGQKEGEPCACPAGSCKCEGCGAKKEQPELEKAVENLKITPKDE